MLVLFGVMLFVPLYLQAAAWQAGFGVQGWFTLATGFPALLEGWPGVIWIHVMAAIPWVTLIAAVGFRDRPGIGGAEPAGRLAREGFFEHLAASRPVGPRHGCDLGGDRRGG